MKIGLLATVAAAAIGALVAGTAPATAAVQEWVLQGVSFDDGTAVAGALSINAYGFLSAPLAVDTTNGAISGYAYTLSDPTSLNNPSDTILELSRGAPNFYDGYLHLEFVDPLNVSAASDPLVLGGASYECDGYASISDTCTGISRLITAGGVAAPEPASLAVLGIGLAGLGLVRRRQRRASSGTCTNSRNC